MSCVGSVQRHPCPCPAPDLGGGVLREKYWRSGLVEGEQVEHIGVLGDVVHAQQACALAGVEQ